MARAVIERELTRTRVPRARFSVATAADDAGIRALLRDNPIPGRISLSFEREPDYFADAVIGGGEKQTIVARKGGRVACIGNCAIRDRFVNGQPSRVGYLGGLRLDSRFAGRFDILRQGYQFFRELQAEDPADFYFTSIAADNLRARKFLEQGVPGMPLYEFIGDFVTLMLPINRRASVRAVSSSAASAVGDLISCVNDYNRSRQFAPSWSVEEWFALEALGLRSEDFYCVRSGNGTLAGAAIWDQRAFKQTVIRGYAPLLGHVRPALNLVAHVAGGLRLPAVGETVANAFVSHLAVWPAELAAFVRELRALAAKRRIEFLTMGFAAKDPNLALVRRNFRCREYWSRLYVVRWPDIGGAAGELDGRLLAPEVALL
ncbi:MAG: hypothetical protein JWR26_406 [Pedosphaera sp.]|nr:hypothetical protein [Pedosphaera sp.]